MNNLDEAWNWYQQTRRALRFTRRLGDKHWDEFPVDCKIFRVDEFKQVDGEALAADAIIALGSLDELAVVKLFAAFECVVRERVGAEVENERKTIAIAHPALSFAAEEVLEKIRRGSFAKVLDFLKELDKDLVEEVRQIRQYRNRISHGENLRVSEKIARVNPKDTYIRLNRFLKELDRITPDERSGNPVTR